MEQINPEQRPGQAYQQPINNPQMPPPNTNLVWAILSTIFCCLPLGIVAIVKATKVENLWYHGYHEEAYRQARSAGRWAMWSAIIPVILWILYFLLIAIGIFAFGDFYEY